MIKSAFEAICDRAQNVEVRYVCLMEKVPFYGGPEEGGWWGEDVNLVAFQECPSETVARELEARVVTLATELQVESKKEYGNQCIRELEWLEARGLDSDFLPEPDGPTEYCVLVTQGIPQNVRGNREYS